MNNTTLAVALSLISKINSALASLGTALTFKGTVSAVADLPASGNSAGDFYAVEANGHTYAWTEGGSWEDLSGVVAYDPVPDAVGLVYEPDQTKYVLKLSATEDGYLKYTILS